MIDNFCIKEFRSKLEHFYPTSTVSNDEYLLFFLDNNSVIDACDNLTVLSQIDSIVRSYNVIPVVVSKFDMDELNSQKHINSLCVKYIIDKDEELYSMFNECISGSFSVFGEGDPSLIRFLERHFDHGTMVFMNHGKVKDEHFMITNHQKAGASSQGEPATETLINL